MCWIIYSGRSGQSLRKQVEADLGVNERRKERLTQACAKEMGAGRRIQRKLKLLGGKSSDDQMRRLRERDEPMTTPTSPTCLTQDPFPLVNQTLSEHLPILRLYSKGFAHIHSFNLYNHPTKEWLILPSLQMRKLRHRAFK